MQSRKTEIANLESKRFVFMGIGLLLIVSVVYSAINYKSYTQVAYDLKMEVGEDNVDLPPITTPSLPPPPPPPPSRPPVEPEIEIAKEEIKEEEKELDDEDPEDLEIPDDIPSDDEPEEVLDNTPMVFVKDMPHFPECKNMASNNERTACTRKLIDSRVKENFVMPEIAKEMGYSGTVWVKFVIDRNGNTTQVEILKGVNKVLDEAALAAVKKLPKMIPGKNLDKPVPILYNIPIKISIN